MFYRLYNKIRVLSRPSGLAGRDALREMLARLQPKEEVLLLGWGVSMPLPVKSWRYDDRFWAELMGGKEAGSGKGKELGS